MRRWLLAFALVAACSAPPSAVPPAQQAPPDRPISDLHFNDPELDAIAERYLKAAGDRGIASSSGQTRVERLVDLEQQLGAPPEALDRVNLLVSELTVTDLGPWARIRSNARSALSGRDDESSRRAADLLQRWQRRKAQQVYGFLSSNYSAREIGSAEWERRFHQFLSENPRDAATWGWIVLAACAGSVREQYGEADSPLAYQFYVASSALGDPNQARYVFSVPGVEPKDAPAGLNPPLQIRGWSDAPGAPQRCSGGVTHFRVAGGRP